MLNCRGYFVPNIVLMNFISFFLKLHPNKETFSLCVNEQTIFLTSKDCMCFPNKILTNYRQSNRQKS